ncbi:MAG TPA: radical SAM protein [Nitrososphaerales archaeon]|nr:radical SAM protein [Nitrososphaerales archaeon]
MAHDVLLIHPPSIYDFRKRLVLPGPIAYTVGESTDQFIIPPIGELSIADYLDRNGYRAAVDNLGERMIRDKNFDAEEHIRRTSAKVYGIDLHWCVHSQGAIEVARICKELHPESLVVMGGLTATRFHDEIVSKYGFVDAVLRGEAEKPFLKLMANLDGRGDLVASENMTHRATDGSLRVEPLMKPEEDIDQFEFTRLDLLEPNGAVYSGSIPPHWSLPVCRGCVYNCATCGGSAYSYKRYLGREKPGFRSPQKIAEDVQKLSEQGVRLVFLFQDPRMGGRKYQDELVAAIRQERSQLESLTLELFQPADQEYVRELSRLGVHVTLTISPESGAAGTRSVHGRGYTNEALLKTVENCQRVGLHMMVFFMVGLANETRATMEETWRLWDQIYSAAEAVRSEGEEPTVIHSLGPMVLLDPGSRAFDSPQEYGYRLISKSLEDYVRAMSSPSWHQWFSYETEKMDRAAIVNLVIDSIERSIEVWEKHGVYDRPGAARERLRHVDAGRLVVGEVDRAMRAESEGEKKTILDSLRRSLDQYGI